MLDPNEQNNLVGQTLTTVQTQQFNFLCNELNALLNQSACTPATSIQEVEMLSVSPVVFPNPMNHLFTVRWAGHETESLLLVDVFGKVAMTGRSGEWNVSQLNPGIYFLQPSGSHSFSSVKVIKLE